MIWAAILSRNLGLFALALDAAVPPIVLLTLIEATLLLLSSAALAWGPSGTGFYVVVTSVSALAIAILACWRNFGRDVLPFGKIVTLPVLLIGKLNLYRRIMSRGRKTQWIRIDGAKTTLSKKRID
jgi:hypothetical protein